MSFLELAVNIKSALAHIRPMIRIVLILGIIAVERPPFNTQANKPVLLADGRGGDISGEWPWGSDKVGFIGLDI